MVAWRQGRLPESGREYAMSRCSVCGTAMLVRGARREEAARLYARPAHRTAALFVPFLAFLRGMRNRERLRFLSDLPTGARIFEVGSGDGRFLATLEAAGYHVAGTEPYVQPAREGDGAPIKRAVVERVELPAQSQDAVVLWHVLEHLEDPAGALRRVRNWLPVGGRLVVAVPNLESLQARIGGGRWFQLDLPRHLVHFTPKGLRQLLERCGFEEQRSSQFVVEQNVVAMWQTLLNRLTRTPNTAYAFVNCGRPLSRRDIAVTVVAGVPLIPLAAAFELGSTLIGRGGSIVVGARASSRN